MVKIPRKAVSGSVDYMDLLIAGGVKFLEERLLARTMIGNGTMKSGLVKLAIGAGARKFAGRGMLQDGVSLGFAIDGVEDILVSLVGGMGQSQNGGSNW
jgi:hypothetical protein